MFNLLTTDKEEMKKTKITCMSLAALMLASSCTSSNQAAGGLTGAMIGSHVGSAVGFLSGHGRYRGDNSALGSLIGMGVGAILGVGIASQIEENEKAKAEQYEKAGRNDGYDNGSDYQTGGGAYSGSATASALVSLSELTYMDADGDGNIAKDEIIEVEGYITNTSNSVLHDIVIHLEVSDPKAFAVSPALTTTLQPGQKIRYTGRVHCRKAHRNPSVNIHLTTTHAGKSYSSSSLMVRIK